jgi:protein tyrosine phosphatase
MEKSPLSEIDESGLTHLPDDVTSSKIDSNFTSQFKPIPLRDFLDLNIGTGIHIYHKDKTVDLYINTDDHWRHIQNLISKQVYKEKPDYLPKASEYRKAHFGYHPFKFNRVILRPTPDAPTADPEGSNIPNSRKSSTNGSPNQPQALPQTLSLDTGASLSLSNGSFKSIGRPDEGYINASYIFEFFKAPENGPKFIATQGPIKASFAHFWKMVWQENVRLIVMLCGVLGDQVTLGDYYWPEVNKVLVFENIKVEFLSVEDG